MSMHENLFTCRVLSKCLLSTLGTHAHCELQLCNINSIQSTLFTSYLFSTDLAILFCKCTYGELWALSVPNLATLIFSMLKMRFYTDFFIKG